MKDKNTTQGICVNGITIAPGVVETIVSLAAAEVPGIASVGSAGAFSTITAALNAGRSVPTAGIKLTVAEDNSIAVDITVQAYYGYRLSDVAEQVRSAIADALKAQIGAETSSVDVHVDALAFEEN